MLKSKNIALAAVLFLFVFQCEQLKGQDISEQVVIRRTNYGVPHIHAKNLMAAGFAMGYVQMEDYGLRVINGLIRSRGEWAKFHELKGSALKNQLDNDAANQLLHMRAVETYSLLSKETRDLIQGYADGVNRYLEKHGKKFGDEIRPDITAYDVQATGIGNYSNASVKTFLRKMYRNEKKSGADDITFSVSNPWASIALQSTDENNPDVGSNAWALSPQRTTSGKAILLRNPHLSWTAGYYEAQMNVDGNFNFYGDFRVGEPLGIVGGFNEFLGWSTTNNYPQTDEIYAFATDPEIAGNYLLDGASRPVEKRTVYVEYKVGNEIKTEKRIFQMTPYGPVIHNTKDKIYIIRASQDGEYRTTEQFLRMMEAKNLEQWKNAMRMQAKATSNFTYADKAGNIFYVWNASIPVLDRPSGYDTTAIFVQKQSEIWKQLYPWDKLPQLLNPKGGYLQNENDPFYYTNLNEVFRETDFPANFPKPKLGLRSQLSLQLIGGNDKLSLEDVIRRKHDMTMLLAYRVKADLIQFAKHSDLNRNERKALKQLEKWDNTVSKNSLGGILFEMWWGKYVELATDGRFVASTPESAGFSAPAAMLFKAPWTTSDPVKTPYGLANQQNAVTAFKWAVKECGRKYGSLNLKWGDIHRAIIGKQDYAVGGATGSLGCFRVLWYSSVKGDSQKLQVSGGDGWILAVEFDTIPRAFSVLAYGESNEKSSPYYADQLKLFVDKKLKKVFYTEADVKLNTIRSYHPGQPDLK